jgi:DnaJ-class molecular chaperone
MQELNAAHETLGDPGRRRIYNRDFDDSCQESKPRRGGRIERNIVQDVRLPIDAFFRGTTLEVKVSDPVNPDGVESYSLEVPPETAPGSRFQVPRTGAFVGGTVKVRLKVMPNYRFKPRGSDLRCDLRIDSRRATQGGSEMIPGPAGEMVRVVIPARVSRGEVLRIRGEGLPKSRGGRGDLLVRITYRAIVKISR